MNFASKNKIKKYIFILYLMKKHCCFISDKKNKTPIVLFRSKNKPNQKNPKLNKKSNCKISQRNN